MTRHSQAGELLRKIVDANRAGRPVGLFSVCSAHPTVLRAAMRHALQSNTILCVESTANQVNQFGGYTGLTPAEFVNHLHSTARELGFNSNKILIGSDHLGPYPWRAEASRVAMEKACVLARECALVGYVKIHLDASMPCADDPTALAYETVAERAAQLCSVVENAQKNNTDNSVPPFYVIGTEVPLPGGEQAGSSAPQVTTVEHVDRTLESFRKAFFQRGLHGAWERVIGLVVQSGAEFGDAHVFDYDSQKTVHLREHLPDSPPLVYEAHSTDYQTAAALERMVRDHFAILKVGPWLTFAYREAIFALSAIEREWLGSRGRRISAVRQQLEAAMLRNPAHWQDYFGSLDPAAQSYARQFSFSDRCRYYWTDSAVQSEVDLLLHNLASDQIPLALISQYFPEQYDSIRSGQLCRSAEALIEQHIRKVLVIYSNACYPHQTFEPHAMTK